MAAFASSANPSAQQQGQAWASQLRQIETALFNGTKSIYDANDIKVYKYEARQ